MSKTSRHGGARSRRSIWGTVAKATASTVTLVALLGLFGIVTVFVPLRGAIDHGDGEASHAVAVGQTTLQTVCPARMQLADTGSYGDAAYRSSEGDITGKTRFASFGSLYDSSVTDISGDNKQKTASVDMSDSTKAFIHQSGADKKSSLHTTRLLETNKGSGAASAMASWATKGDLQGVSSTRCVVPQLTQSLLLPGTQTGWTQQLVLSNPSDKSTTVAIEARGTKSGEPIALATDSKVTVAANGETVVNLSAAAPSQQGLYVTLNSTTTAVAAVVRVVHAEGLVSRGSDFATSVGVPSETLMLPAVASGSDVTVEAFAEKAGEATLSWVTKAKTIKAKTIRLDANKVAVLSLGKAPSDAVGVSVSADVRMNAAAMCVENGSDQSDFSLVQAADIQEVSAIALPEGIDALIDVVNTTDDKTTVTLTAYSQQGDQAGVKEITLSGHQAVSLAPKDVAKNAAALTLHDTGKAVAWGAVVRSDAVSKAKVSGLGYIGSTSLMPMQASVRVNRSLDIVQ
ncbi:hypothetical protein GFD17_05000 [Bifidobacterium sp. SMB2]|uniref:Organic solvents resistance ABC transporter permease n=1 Tax=Bifidobacterium saimiriisciurei TaxID=2661627 RepID=A0ABX0C6K5_9BIFI|nr:MULTISPECIES: DUF5719 family protein [Bifidobacterium]NEG96123.1 hypothetical protein [Bifidobacterium sp. SMB2]NEH10799.1 hypothetical protein [Bifidobacterium saimiriisciurei]